MKDKNRTMLLDVPDEMQKITPKKVMVSSGSKSGFTCTADATYQLFQKESKSINEISVARNVSELTIESHLIDSYNDGKKLDLSRLGFTETVYDTIKEVLEENADKKLRFIKMKLPNNISYFHINLARIGMTNEDNSPSR